MELQIQDLVTSIRKEGVDAANAEADSIIAEARKKADAIISEAKAEAGATKAKRDAMLSFKTEVQKKYEELLKKDIKKELSDEALGKLIRAAVAGEDVSKYAAEVAEVSEGLKAELADEVKKGLEIRPTRGVNAGFRLASKDGSGYFDCTDEAIAEMMMPYFRNLEI